jgi:hypothetical protein
MHFPTLDLTLEDFFAAVAAGDLVRLSDPAVRWSVMTAAPLSDSLSKVRALLPVKIVESDEWITLRDKHGRVFCYVPRSQTDDAQARADLIRDAMNEMA